MEENLYTGIQIQYIFSSSSQGQSSIEALLKAAQAVRWLKSIMRQCQLQISEVWSSCNVESRRCCSSNPLCNKLYGVFPLCIFYLDLHSSMDTFYFLSYDWHSPSVLSFCRVYFNLCTFLYQGICSLISRVATTEGNGKREGIHY